MLLHPYAERAVGHKSPSPIYYRLVDAVGEHFITQHAVVDRVERLREIEEDQVDSFAGVHYARYFLFREEEVSDAGPSGDEAMLRVTQRSRDLEMA